MWELDSPDNQIEESKGGEEIKLWALDSPNNQMWELDSPNKQNVSTRLTKQPKYEHSTYQTKRIVMTILTHLTTKKIERESKLNGTKPNEPWKDKLTNQSKSHRTKLNRTKTKQTQTEDPKRTKTNQSRLIQITLKCWKITTTQR